MHRIPRLLGEAHGMKFSDLWYWAVISLAVALVAALPGFGTTGTALEISKIIFWGAIAVAIASFAINALRKA
jgi:uncharacterized membrane protein YtjA (UPF0391 family)